MASRLACCGAQPNSRRAFSAEATRRGGSPGRRGFSTVAIRSGFFQIGTPQHVVLVAEGYATGASLHAATGLPVAIAFDANNQLYGIQNEPVEWLVDEVDGDENVIVGALGILTIGIGFLLAAAAAVIATTRLSS